MNRHLSPEFNGTNQQSEEKPSDLHSMSIESESLGEGENIDSKDEVRRLRFLELVSRGRRIDKIVLKDEAQREMEAMLELQEVYDIRGGAELSDQELENFIACIIDGAENGLVKQNIKVIRDWVSQSQGKSRFERKKQVHDAVAHAIRPGVSLRLPVLVLLGEIDQLREELMNGDELTDALETNVCIDPEAEEQIAFLNQSNDPRGNVLMHKIFDFAQTHKSTLENYTPEEQDEKRWYGTSISEDFYNIARRQNNFASNYLIQKHLQDILEMSSYGNMDKPGSVHGVAGGGSDGMIYTFRNIERSYKDRLALGIREGWPIANPVLPIAPDYFGLYKGDRLQKVFMHGEIDEVAVREKERAHIVHNNPEDDYIYEELNRHEVFHPGRNYHPSHELGKLEYLWAFKKHLQAEGRNFFYDTARLEDPSRLHPIVLGELFQRNQEYIDRVEGKQNDAEPVAIMQYKNLLSPGGHEKPEEEYIYRHMVSLPMRKKIEDDFGINIENIPLYGQIQFVNFLNRADLKTAERLQEALKQSGGREHMVISFLACAEDPLVADSILTIAEQAKPELSEALFGKYAEIVGHSEKVREFLLQELANSHDLSEKFIRSTIGQLFSKANELLKAVASALQTKKNLDSRSLVEHINNYRSEVALLASALRHIKGVELTEIKQANLQVKDSSELSDREKKEMSFAFKTNRERLYPGGLKDYTVDGFSHLLDEPGHAFYIFDFKDHPAVFFHVDKKTADTWYVGSLNLGPEAFDSPLAIAVIKAALEQEGGEHNLEAKVYEHNPARKFYTRILGFKETTEIEIVEDDSGKKYKYIKLVRPKQEELSQKLPKAA